MGKNRDVDKRNAGEQPGDWANGRQTKRVYNTQMHQRQLKREREDGDGGSYNDHRRDHDRDSGSEGGPRAGQDSVENGQHRAAIRSYLGMNNGPAPNRDVGRGTSRGHTRERSRDNDHHGSRGALGERDHYYSSKNGNRRTASCSSRERSGDRGGNSRFKQNNGTSTGGTRGRDEPILISTAASGRGGGGGNTNANGALLGHSATNDRSRNRSRGNSRAEDSKNYRGGATGGRINVSSRGGGSRSRGGGREGPAQEPRNHTGRGRSRGRQTSKDSSGHPTGSSSELLSSRSSSNQVASSSSAHPASGAAGTSRKAGSPGESLGNDAAIMSSDKHGGSAAVGAGGATQVASASSSGGNNTNSSKRGGQNGSGAPVSSGGITLKPRSAVIQERKENGRPETVILRRRDDIQPNNRAPPGHHRDGGGGISLSARDDALPQHHPPARLELRSRREVNADRRQDADSEIDLQPGAANMGRSGHNDSGYPDQHRGGGHFHDARVGSPGGARRGSSGDRDHQMFYNEGSGHHAPAGSPHYGPHSGLFVGGGGGASSSKNLPYLAKCGGEQLRSTSGGGRKRERGLNVAASMEDDDLRDGTNGGRRGGDKNSVRNQEDSEVEDSTPRSNDESSDEEASGQNEESSDDSSEEERSPGSSRQSEEEESGSESESSPRSKKRKTSTRARGASRQSDGSVGYVQPTIVQSAAPAPASTNLPYGGENQTALSGQAGATSSSIGGGAHYQRHNQHQDTTPGGRLRSASGAAQGSSTSSSRKVVNLTPNDAAMEVNSRNYATNANMTLRATKTQSDAEAAAANEQAKDAMLDEKLSADPRHILLVTNIPADKYQAEIISEHFGKFGKIADVKLQPEDSMAIIYYNEWKSVGAACRHSGLHITLGVNVRDPKKQFASADSNNDQLDNESKRLLSKYTAILQKLMSMVTKLGANETEKRDALNAKMIKVKEQMAVLTEAKNKREYAVDGAATAQWGAGGAAGAHIAYGAYGAGGHYAAGSGGHWGGWGEGKEEGAGGEEHGEEHGHEGEEHHDLHEGEGHQDDHHDHHEEHPEEHEPATPGGSRVQGEENELPRFASLDQHGAGQQNSGSLSPGKAAADNDLPPFEE